MGRENNAVAGLVCPTDVKAAFNFEFDDIDIDVPLEELLVEASKETPRWRVMLTPLPRNSDGNPDSPQVVVFLTSIIDIIKRLCNVLHTLASFVQRITYTSMSCKTAIRLVGVARNQANGFPARLLGRRVRRTASPRQGAETGASSSAALVGVSIAARAHRPSRCLSPRLQHPAQDFLDTLQAAIADRKPRRELYLMILLMILDIQEAADGRSKTPWTLLNGDRS